MAENILHTLMIDFTGKLVYFDNQDIVNIFTKSSFFNLIFDELKSELIEIMESVKHGQEVIWDKEKKLFNDSFGFQIFKFKPVYQQNKEIKYVSISLYKIDHSNLSKPNTEVNKFEYMFNNSKDAIFVTDIEGNYIEVNTAATARTGFNRSEFLKLNIKDTPTKSSYQLVSNYLHEILIQGESTSFIDYITLYGKIIETEISGKKIIFAGTEAILHISREISGRNQKHAENLDSIIQSEEKERRALAYEINDILGPNLSLAKMFIESYFKTKDPIIKEEIIRKAKDAIDKSLDDITLISNKLSPHILKNLGLKIALEVFIKRLQETSNIKFILDIEIPEKQPDNIAIVSYRAVTEILMNIIKHSKATKVHLNAKIKKNSIIFDLMDDGVGFDVNEVMLTKKFKGIYNITNKIKSIRGTIDIGSKIGEGTQIKIEIPNYEETKN